MTDQKLPVGTKHGGAGALKAIRQGKPFSGLARIAEKGVEDRLQLEGIEGELVRDAKRLQVASDLYYDAFVKAIQDGDIDAATSHLRNWAWVHNSAIRAWNLINKFKPKDHEADVIKIIDQYRQDADPGGNDA